MSVAFTCEWTKERVVFLNIAEYEESVYWGHTRTRYERSDRPHACVICGAESYELHHLHYRNVGYEDLDDLMPLCEDHHYEVEKHVRTVKSDLSREAATYDYIERLGRRAEGGRIQGPVRFVICDINQGRESCPGS